jgi:hypothetical protein
VNVNNYPATLYGPGEIVIQTNPRQLEATRGRVYLTRWELTNLLDMCIGDSPDTEDDRSRRVGTSPDLEGRKYRVTRQPSAYPGLPWVVIEKAHDVVVAAFDGITDAKKYLHDAETQAEHR